MHLSWWVVGNASLCCQKPHLAFVFDTVERIGRASIHSSHRLSTPHLPKMPVKTELVERYSVFVAQFFDPRDAGLPRIWKICVQTSAFAPRTERGPTFHVHKDGGSWTFVSVPDEMWGRSCRFEGSKLVGLLCQSALPAVSEALSTVPLPARDEDTNHLWVLRALQRLKSLPESQVGSWNSLERLQEVMEDAFNAWYQEG